MNIKIEYKTRVMHVMHDERGHAPDCSSVCGFRFLCETQPLARLYNNHVYPLASLCFIFFYILSYEMLRTPAQL